MMMSSWSRHSVAKFLVSAFFLLAFLGLFLPFYAELLMAALFAFAMEPTLGRWLKPRSLRWKPFVALALFTLFLLLAVPVTLVIYKAYGNVLEVSRSGFQNTEVFQKLMQVKNNLIAFVNSTLERFGLEDRFDLAGIADDAIPRSVNFLVQFASGTLQSLPGLLISLFIFSAALYYFLAEARTIKELFLRQKLLRSDEANRFINVLQRSCFNTVITSVIIALLQASIVAIGAVSLGAGDFTIVWVITFFTSFVPVLGAGPVALALGLYEVILGNYLPAIGLTVVAVVAGTVDNVVRPYLISSGDNGLHPVVSLLAIIGALVIFGMPGLFLGPVIASVAIKIIPTLYVDHSHGNDSDRPSVKTSDLEKTGP